MTTLISWIGIDPNGAGSIYIASDSRITWTIGKTISGKWNYGRKVFASTKFADIFGYSGLVAFPAMVLGQIVVLIDSGALYQAETPPWEREQLIFDLIKTSHGGYPHLYSADFTILYCSKFDADGGSTYFQFVIEWEKSTKTWTRKVLEFPLKSGELATSGTGAPKWELRHDAWKKALGFTTRGIFSALGDMLRNGDDPHSGGSPQLVGIYHWNRVAQR